MPPKKYTFTPIGHYGDPNISRVYHDYKAAQQYLKKVLEEKFKKIESKRSKSRYKKFFCDDSGCNKVI